MVTRAECKKPSSARSLSRVDPLPSLATKARAVLEPCSEHHVCISGRAWGVLSEADACEPGSRLAMSHRGSRGDPAPDHPQTWSNEFEKILAGMCSMRPRGRSGRLVSDRLRWTKSGIGPHNR